MSNTFRKDRDGKIYKESLKKKDARYKCYCEYCTNVFREKLTNKISKRETKEEIKIIETGENIDFDIPKQDEILEQIMGRNT